MTKSVRCAHVSSSCSSSSSSSSSSSYACLNTYAAAQDDSYRCSYRWAMPGPSASAWSLVDVSKQLIDVRLQPTASRRSAAFVRESTCPSQKTMQKTSCSSSGRPTTPIWSNESDPRSTDGNTQTNHTDVHVCTLSDKCDKIASDGRLWNSFTTHFNALIFVQHVVPVDLTDCS